MEYEVEFHPVGDASRAGDAISVRYRTITGYGVVVVDGGTEDSGTHLVEHILAHYGPDVVIDHVVSTHPDSDHASGLRPILETFFVKNLWVHGLWTHAAAMRPYFKDQRWTVDGLADAIRGEYSIIDELRSLALKQRTAIREPFQGASIGPFIVLSPNIAAYQRLVPQFRRTPEPNEPGLIAERMWLGKTPGFSPEKSLLEAVLERARTWIDEAWNIELLKEGGSTSAENESCVVLYGAFGTDSVLLTADAGVNALLWSIDYASKLGIDLRNVNMLQVPHHGSRSNVSPSVLDALLGVKVPSATPQRRIAIVSAPKDDDKHPRKMVMNAFLRRATPVYATQGIRVRHYSGMPPRPGERALTPLPFFNRVEQYD